MLETERERVGEGYLKTRLKRQKISPKAQAECEGLPSQERHLVLHVLLDAAWVFL